MSYIDECDALSTTTSTSFRRSRGRYRETIRDIFERAQHSPRSEPFVKEFLEIFDEIYDTRHRPELRRETIKLIHSVTAGPRLSPYTKRMLTFVANLFRDLQKYFFDDDDESEEFDTYMDKFMSFLYSEVSDVRYNSMHLISLIVKQLDDIDCDTFSSIQKAFVELALNDRESFVRSKAFCSLGALLDRVQFDEDIVAETLEAISTCFEYEQEIYVRAYALKCLPVESCTISHFLVASLDPAPLIRKKVIEKLAICANVTDFYHTNLHQFLKNAFYDTKEIRTVVLKNFLPKLIKKSENDIVLFVRFLQVHHDNEFYEELFNAYFDILRANETNVSEKNDFFILVASFIDKHLDNTTRLITNSPINSGLVFVWFMLSNYSQRHQLTKLSAQLTQSNETEIEEVLDLADDLLPVIDQFCTFFITAMNAIIEKGKVKHQEATLKYFLKIANLFSYRLEYHHDLLYKTLETLAVSDMIYDMMAGGEYIDEIFKLFSALFPEPDIFFRRTIGIIEQIDKNRDESIMEIDDDDDEDQRSSSAMSEEKSWVWCLQIFEAFLKAGTPKHPDDVDGLQEFVEKNILRGFDSECDRIVLLSIRCLWAYCIASANLINKYSFYFFKYLRTKNMTEKQVFSLQAVLDFACAYGFESLSFTLTDPALNSLESAFAERKSSEEILVKFIRKYFHSPLTRCDTFKESEWTMDYRLFTTATIGICKLAKLGHFWSMEFFSKLILMFLNDKKIGDYLYNYLEVFFNHFADVFETAEPEFKRDIASPFVECYIDVVKQIFASFSGDNLAGVKELVESFFLSTCVRHYGELVRRACDIINSPQVGSYEKLQLFNIDLLMTMDFTRLTLNELTIIQDTSLSQDVHIVQVHTNRRVKRLKTDPVQEALRKLNRKVERALKSLQKTQGSPQASERGSEIY